MKKDDPLRWMRKELERDAMRRRAARDRGDDDDDGGALVPARPPRPGPKPLAGAMMR